MNADKMTREEFYYRVNEIMDRGDTVAEEALWSRINAIQSAPFVPDWDVCPTDAIAFQGVWVFKNRPALQEFYIPAPSNPSDSELSAMWEKLDRDKRVQILRDAGVVV